MSINIEKIPEHVAIIPDGNRRWAKKRGLQPWVGHQVGAKKFEKILEKALKLEIPYLTFWGGSWDNLTKRPKLEIKFLFKVYGDWFKKIAEDERIRKHEVRIDFLGRWKEILPVETKKIIEKAKEATKDYNKHFLTFLIAYDGRDEMMDCIKKIAKSPKVKINDKTIKENLWTKNLPRVDLVIRTGCENDPHMSAGFMMWDTAYSQLHFSKTLLPDFKPEEFEKIIRGFSGRERRFGK
jgi:tritrans,polycis-undecaprenyl-diphosphate synthase [geranylgeranyl-diphosphate specific]